MKNILEEQEVRTIHRCQMFYQFEGRDELSHLTEIMKTIWELMTVRALRGRSFNYNQELDYCVDWAIGKVCQNRSLIYIEPELKKIKGYCLRTINLLCGKLEIDQLLPILGAVNQELTVEGIIFRLRFSSTHKRADNKIVHFVCFADFKNNASTGTDMPTMMKRRYVSNFWKKYRPTSRVILHTCFIPEFKNASFNDNFHYDSFTNYTPSKREDRYMSSFACHYKANNPLPLMNCKFQCPYTEECFR